MTYVKRDKDKKGRRLRRSVNGCPGEEGGERGERHEVGGEIQNEKSLRGRQETKEK